MEQPASQSPPSDTALFGGRYEISAQQSETVEVLDHQPWKRCWACGATSNEAGEMFCTECGAALEGRHYTGQLLGDTAPHGLALVPTVEDPVARAMLPDVWDQQREDNATLTLVASSVSEAIAPPLDEIAALHVGLGLARLLEALHRQGFTLGAITTADVELRADGKPRLRAVPHLRHTDAPQETAADLPALAGLLEELTATPRTTQRLSEEQADAIADEPGLPAVLRSLRTGAITDASALVTQLDAILAEKTHPVALLMRIGSTTDKGMVRDIDEDSLLVLDLRTVQNALDRTWGLFIVADGMGGHSAGEVASGLAIRGAAEVVMRAYLTPTLELDMDDEEARMKDIVHKAIIQANEYVMREARARSNDMGTTITMALVAGDRVVVGNVGDSRTYMYRDGALRRISKDHSLVMRLVELGQISDEDVYTHPQRNAVLRSLGDKSDVQVDVFSERLRPGDALLLCSDGQWEMTHDPRMNEIIGAHDDPQHACTELIKAANAAGGEDNITSVLVRFG